MGSNPALFTIPRTGAAHDATPENAEGYSASAIRHLLAEGRRADALSRMVPAMRAVYEAEESAGRAPVFAAACERAILARLRSMTPAEFDALDTGHEGVGQRLFNASRSLSPDAQRLFETESRAADLYALAYPELTEACGSLWRQNPVMP